MRVIHVAAAGADRGIFDRYAALGFATTRASAGALRIAAPDLVTAPLAFVAAASGSAA